MRERIVTSVCATLSPMLKAHASEELYALAITTDSDVVTLRLVAHTEEALGTLLEENDVTADEEADHYRWWPDEWRISDDDVSPENGVESTADISEAMLAASDARADDPYTRRDLARAALEGALGDPRVRAGIAEVNPGWHPVLFVADTDGDTRPTARSIDDLNQGHPDPALIASARGYLDP
ncbi:hypothetical protein AQJ66_14075 [Streptomyces bungoensis]|uniref:DUF4303 domain-containing protein n=2 Tax=Streptomyces bungoensis TaxID=285568 RepID=A0A101T3X3_9ACTN|nr:hypothetical protein AQJ66_14075 [Streptomyces bungoensis]